MRRSTLLLAVVLAATTQVGTSQAAACPLLTDPRGDSTPVVTDQKTPVDSQVSEKETDIVSADAWTEKDLLHVVIRVGALPGPGTRPFGHEWDLMLRGEDRRLHLATLESNGNYHVSAAVEELTGSEDAGAGSFTNLQGAYGSRDLATGTMRMTFPLGLAAPLMRVSPGTRLMPVVYAFRLNGASSFRTPFAYMGPGGVGTQADVARGKRAMHVGRPDCVVRRR